MAKLAIFIDDPRFDMLSDGQEDAIAAYADAIKSGIVDLTGDVHDCTISLVAVHVIANHNDVKLTLIPTDSSD